MKLRFGAMLIVLALLGACRPQADLLREPPEIHYGEDVCVFCKMIISDPRFAAGYHTADGESRIFDDIGGMLTHHVQQQEEVIQFWVHDHTSEAWLAAGEAHFVLGESIHSPMGWGIAAFAEAGDAASFAEEYQGEVITFNDLLARFESTSISSGEPHSEMGDH